MSSWHHPGYLLAQAKPAGSTCALWAQEHAVQVHSHIESWDFSASCLKVLEKCNKFKDSFKTGYYRVLVVTSNLTLFTVRVWSVWWNHILHFDIFYQTFNRVTPIQVRIWWVHLFVQLSVSHQGAQDWCNCIISVLWCHMAPTVKLAPTPETLPGTYKSTHFNMWCFSCNHFFLKVALYDLWITYFFS